MSALETEQSLPQSEATAEQLLTRLLKLIKSSTGIGDFTANLEPALGVSMQHVGPGKSGYRARLTPNWNCTLIVYQTYALGPRVLLDFFTTSGSRTPMTGICGVDVRKFTSELTLAGFSNSVRYGEHGWRMGNLLQRDGLSIELSACSEADQPQDKFQHRCIRSIVVR